MVASENSPESPPLNEQVPQQMRIGIEISLDPDMPEPQLSRSPLAGDQGSDNCLGLFCWVNVNALKTWAKVTKFMYGSFGYSVEEPEVTEDFREFFKFLYGINRESRVLCSTDRIIEQLEALLYSFSKVTSRQRTVWCRHFESWTPCQIQDHLLWLAKPGVFFWSWIGLRVFQ